MAVYPPHAGTDAEIDTGDPENDGQRRPKDPEDSGGVCGGNEREVMHLTNVEISDGNRP